MKPRLSVDSRSTILALTLVCLIVPFCLGYMFFVASQRSYYTNRNLRALDNIGNQLRQKVENLATSLANVGRQAKNEGGKSGGGSLDVEALRKAIGQVDRYGTNLKLETTSLPSSPEQKTPQQSAPREPSTSPAVSMTVKPDSGSFALLFEYRSGQPAGNQVGFQASSDIDRVIRPMVNRYLSDEANPSNEDLFDEMLVAEQSTGRVIFIAGDAWARVIDINGLVQPGAAEKAPRLSDASTSAVDVDVAGNSYKLFLQPIQISVPSSNESGNAGVRWVICGLIRSSHLRDETFSVSYTLVISFFFLLIMVLLSVPFLKLRLMGSRDRLTRGNLWSTALSAVLGTSLLTFLLVDSYTYIELGSRLDDQLERLACDIKHNFSKELTRALRQLTQLNERLLNTSQDTDAPAALVDLKNSIGRTVLPNTGKEAKPPTYYQKTNLLETELNGITAPYPFFNNVIWIDPSGQQRIKWTTRTETSPFISVENRSYFKNARDGNLWSITDGADTPKPSEYHYFLELVNSKNTGENVAIISTRVPGSDWILTMDTRLLSLIQTVLPSGYGYCIIDASGNVLFHSQEVKNLEEKFFEECRNDGLLRSAVLSRTEELINTQYLGRGHRLYVTPVKDTQWSLVVFRDKQMLRTMNLEILTLSFLLFLAFGVVMVLLVMILRWVHAKKRNEWLWPDESRSVRYSCVLLVNLLLGLVYVPFLVLGEGRILILVSCLIPAAGIVLFTAHAGSSIPKIVQFLAARLGLFRLPGSVGYTLSLTTLLVLISVLPTLAYFKTARDFEMTKLIRHGQMSVAAQLQARYDRVKYLYAGIRIGSQNELKGQFIERKRLGPVKHPNWDVYCSFFFNTEQTAIFDGEPQTERLTDSLQWLTWISPLYNQTSIETHELSRDSSADKSWSSGGNPYTGMSLLKQREGNASQPGINIRSSVKRFEDISSPGWWGSMLAYTILVLGLAYLIVWFVGKRVFLLGFARPRPFPDHNLQTAPIRRNVVLIGSPLANGLDKWPPQIYYLIDLVEVVNKPNNEPHYESLDPQLAVVMQNFDFNMNDPAANFKKLDMLELFLKQGRTVIVVSATPPATFTLVDEKAAGVAERPHPQDAGEAPSDDGEGTAEDGAPLDGDGNAQQAGSSRRWADAFQTFDEIYRGEAEAAAPMDAEEKSFYGTLKCRHRLAYLERIRIELKSDSAEDALSGDELVNEVADRARPFHEVVWLNCSRDQKLTLIHIALNGLISFHSNGLRSLMKSGLVVRNPALGLMDEAFRRFVAARSFEEQFWIWEKEGKRSYWELAKVPLGVVAITVAVFLFVTQKEFYDSTMTVMSAAAGGLAVLMKVLGFFQGKQPSASA